MEELLIDKKRLSITEVIGYIWCHLSAAKSTEMPCGVIKIGMMKIPMGTKFIQS